MRGMQQRHAGRFVHASRFHPDESILHQIDSPYSVLAA
jgi:hypothetical protein